MTQKPPNISDLRIHREAPSARSDDRGKVITAMVVVTVLGVAAVLWIRAPRAIAVQIGSATVTGGAVDGGAGISANGYVVARTKASVSAKIAGRMEYLGVTEGSTVRTGEVIARIESGIYRAQVEAAKARSTEVEVQLVQARRDLVRARTLREKDLISSVELENAATRVDALEASLNSAVAERRLAEESLENTLVRAPFDGTILRKDAEVGEIVAPASAGGGLTRTAIVTMADLSTLEVEVDVNEAYIAQITNGQDARITLDAYSDTSFTGRVRQVVPTADRQKATVLVKVAILDRDPRILPEMGAKVVFTTAPGTAVAAAPLRISVPQNAVVRDGASAKVWVVDRDQATSRVVEIGRESDTGVEIRSGLLGNEALVLDPPAGLKDGARVRAAKP